MTNDDHLVIYITVKQLLNKDTMYIISVVRKVHLFSENSFHYMFEILYNKIIPEFATVRLSKQFWSVKKKNR